MNLWYGLCLLGILSMALAACAAPADIVGVRPTDVQGRIDPRIYGQFLEHIYHSVEDGLFGELVQNRAFVGQTRIARTANGLELTSPATDVKAVFGDPKWTDYELTLKARKTSGAEGFLILVRATDDRDFYWWNLGGWGNTAHQIEVEKNDQRRGIGPRVAGRIEAGRWYDIKMRVEGDHIQGWIDGALVLDMRDATHPRGGVGAGFWATCGEYKDIRVTTLAGAELPLSLAAQPDLQALPTEWQGWPDGSDRARLVELPDSPNTGFGARIDLGGSTGALGIAQERFNIVKGHRYTGSVWVKAEGTVNKLTVSLVGKDGKVLARRVLGPPSRQLEERRFTLSPDASDSDARLAITAEGSGRLIVDMVSMMRGDYVATGCRTDLLKAVAGLKPPIIRWPGGCFASIYRWKRAIGPQNERKPFHNHVWGEWDSCGFGIDEYMRMCRKLGAEPMVVVNLGSWDDPSKEEEYIREALEWIEYCNGDATTPMGALRAKNGHPAPYNVVHWEMDNETWAMGVERYGKLVAKVASQIRQRWPGLRIYACTFWEKEDARLLELCGQYIDYISYHFYENPDAYGTAPGSFEALWDRYAKLIASSANPTVRLAVTEWNAQSTDWRTGLFAGGYLNVMERSAEVVTMATPALFLRRVDARDWDNAFINHDHRSWFPAPNYVVMKLYRDHFQPLRVASDAPAGLNVVATRSEDGKILIVKVVNATKQAVATEVAVQDAGRVARAKAWQVSAGLSDRNTLKEPTKIAPVSIPARFEGGKAAMTFPALSVTLIEVALTPSR